MILPNQPIHPIIPCGRMQEDTQSVLNSQTTVSRLTCVWDEPLQVGPGPLVLQQLLWRHVCEEDLQDDLSVLAVFGVGVPHDAVSKESLWVGLTAVERARMIKINTLCLLLVSVICQSLVKSSVGTWKSCIFS